jgi:hypothetical protein
VVHAVSGGRRPSIRWEHVPLAQLAAPVGQPDQLVGVGRVHVVRVRAEPSPGSGRRLTGSVADVTSFSVPARFCGPPVSGHGGWTSGALAERIGGRVEVTLRNPPPLDTEMVIELDGDHARVLHGDVLIAECEPTDAAIEAPPFIDLETARAAAETYVGLTRHPFSTCFTCGAGRPHDDGLRVFPGLVEGRELVVAAPMEVPADLVSADGTLSLPIVWAALDCPTIWPYMSQGIAALLGRMRVDVHGPVPGGRPLVVVGRGDGAEGRKRFCSGALYTAEGDLLAASHTTWITIDDPRAVIPG